MSEQNHTRLGNGEPVDAYQDPDFASELEDWTAKVAAEFDSMYLARIAINPTKQD